VPNLGRYGGQFNQMKQALHCIFAVLLLTAKPSGFDNDFTRKIHAPARQAQQTLPDFRPNRLRIAGVKTQLNRCGFRLAG